ncbi:hypothetical protein MMC18_007205 [Xylographa bjoerkii]|nr:hypothetical protein [Xylographa bjoerkii]
MPRKDVATKSIVKSSYFTVAQSPADDQEISSNDEVRRRHQSAASTLRAFFARSFTKTTKTARRIAEGAPSEEPKLLATHSKLRALTVCLIHVVPILASTTLAVMNLKGYYIGAQLSGSSDPSTQALYTLCLQVTAKLLVGSMKYRIDIADEYFVQELMVVASLGVIVLDVIRYLLFFDDQGLPLGLAGTKTKLHNVTFLASPEFWSGIRGLESWRKRILVTLLTVICCLSATLIGPSSALLLIPVVRTDWPAGGTLFWLSGNESTLWPDTLDSSSIGGQECLTPTADEIYAETLNNSGCIWYWTPGLSQYAKELHFNVNIFNVTVFDTVTAREMQRRSSGDTWALSNMAHIARMAWAIGLQWRDAALSANENWSRFSTGSSFAFRERTGTVTKVHSPIPAVRTKCGVYGPADFNSTDVFAYPMMPPYSSAWAANNNYGISPELYPNTSVITTRWLRKQTGPNLTFNHTTVDSYPSAFLTVQVPYPGSTTQGTVFTCSIDARWAEGNNVGTNVDSTTDIFLQHGEVDSNAAVFAYTDMILPVDDGTWRTVDLDISWLEALSPVLNASDNIVSNHTLSPEILQSPGWTTLSSIFQQAGYDNSTGDIDNWSDLAQFTEMIIALLVADGMSRIGLTQNSGTANQIGDFGGSYFPWLRDWNSLVSALLSGGSAISPPDPKDGPTTSLDWTVFIEGYSYAADSKAYYLALTVVFVYMALALTHIGYTLRKRWFSNCWNEVPKLLALGHNSTPSELLENTSAGIEAHATNRLTLKVRVPVTKAGEQERVCLVVGLDTREFGYRRVEVGKKYA